MTSEPREPLRIGAEVIAPATSAHFSLPVFTDLDGSNVSVPLHVLHGGRPGPTLTLLSMLHGDEWSMLETLRDLLTKLDARTMSGTLLVVPIGNPYAFRQLRRTSRETLEFDAADLNRAFPGDQTWLTRRIADIISREILARTTHLIDFHPGPFGSAWMQVVIGADLPGDLPRRSEEMARAFGITTINRSENFSVLPGPRSATGYAGSKLGIPSIIAEVGGLGFDERLERRWRELNVNGVLGVMRQLSMFDSQPVEDTRSDAGADRFRFFTKEWVVRPTTSGLLVPAIGQERLGTRAEKDELLGRIISPTTLAEIEALRAPRDGILFCVARSYPVQPHNYAFGAADLTNV